MLTYLGRRMLQSIFVIVGVTALSYGVLFLAGDPAAAVFSGQDVPQAVIEHYRHQMGYDQPWYVQYLQYGWRVLHGDLGNSVYQGVNNASLIAGTLPATIQLGLVSTAITIAIGIPLGVLAAYKRNSFADRASMVGTLIMQSMPAFWLGLVLLLVFGERLRWFPVSGRTGWSSIVLPALTLSALSIARTARMMRSSMLDALGQDYIRTARSKGLRERLVLYRHALKNSMIPVVTLIGIDVGYRLGGSVVVETIFSWPGLGRLLIQAINTKDVPLIQASVIVLALTFVLVNLAVDVIYAYLDPRIRLQ
jgi:peptide/nickel transport system permease protein